MTTNKNDPRSPDADAARLALRLRQLADEIESAHRFGVPIPTVVSVSSHMYGDVRFSATPEMFDAWADYCQDSVVTEYDHDGKHWWNATADVNGLPLRFAASGVPILVNDEVPA